MGGRLARVIDARGAERRARGLPRRSRRHVLLAVALASTAIVGVHVPAVSATGLLGSPAHRRATQTFRYYMDVARPRNTLCLGESAVYTVYVYRDATTGPSSPSAMDGVKVEAYPADPNVGTFIGKDQGKQWTGPGFYDEPLSADFTFKAGKKPGKTTLVFQGAVKGVDIHVGYVSFNVDIKVIQCKYTVSGSTSFPPNGKDNPDIVYPRLIAKLKKVQLVSDADGHLTGSTSIHWKSASLSSGCVVNETFSADGQVTINGDVADDGVLTLTFAFTSVAGFATETCGPASASNTYPYQIDPLTIDVPTKGGVVTPKITQSGFPGVASIVVKPVKEG